MLDVNVSAKKRDINNVPTTKEGNMRYIFKGLALLAMVSLLLTSCAKAPPTPPATELPGLLVETDWLAQHLDDPNLRIVDVRAADDYLQGHIPNAVNLPRKTELSDPDNPIKGMVLPKEKIEPLLGGLGISNQIAVVAVDDTGGKGAGRLSWIL